MNRQALTKRLSPARNYGFTLAEMMVALSIFAVIGVGSWQILHQALLTQERMQASSAKLSELQRAMWILENDMRSIVNRPITTEYDQIEPAASTLKTGTLFTFTSSSWLNPLNEPRGRLQRVAYQLEANLDHSGAYDLIRQYWQALDRNNQTAVVKQRLIIDIEYFEVEFIDQQGLPRKHWPPSELQESSTLPSSVIIHLGTKQHGDIERFFNLQDKER